MDRTVKEVNGSLLVTIPRRLARRRGIQKGDTMTFQETDGGLLLKHATRTEKVLWTVGYEGQDQDSFVGLLKSKGIKALVDVRELPLSRRKGFSKTPLSGALRDAGVDYVHLRALGAPKDVRKPFIAGGSFATFRQEYLDHLEKQRDTLDDLARLAEREPVAIMCVERVHSVCHRQFVAGDLAERGFEIHHF